MGGKRKYCVHVIGLQKENGAEVAEMGLLVEIQQQ